MTVVHICEVCFVPSEDHQDREYWPPRCCHGCPCGETWPAEPTVEPEEDRHGE